MTSTLGVGVLGEMVFGEVVDLAAPVPPIVVTPGGGAAVVTRGRRESIARSYVSIDRERLSATEPAVFGVGVGFDADVTVERIETSEFALSLGLAGAVTRHLTEEMFFEIGYDMAVPYSRMTGEQRALENLIRMEMLKSKLN